MDDIKLTWILLIRGHRAGPVAYFADAIAFAERLRAKKE